MEDRRAGEIVAMLYNINRDVKKDPKGKTWLDIFPDPEAPKVAPREQTGAEILESMRMWATLINKAQQPS